MKNLLTISALFLFLTTFTSCGPYNSIIEKSESVDMAWGNVQSQYQRRLDLIDNLVETVKGAADFEQKTFVDLAKARAGIQEPTQEMLADKEQLAAFYEQQNALKKQAQMMFNINVEAYPDLKATQAFRDFMNQLEGTENRINNARDEYNAAVKDYNTYIKQVPANIYNMFMKYEAKNYFESDPGAKNAPKVDFGD